MERDRRVIVGAGFAGLATAYHLARRGVAGLLVLEQESGPGRHASGRNAGLLRQSSADAALVPLLRSGARAARRILTRTPGGCRPSGSLILGANVKDLQPGAHAKLVDAQAVLEGLSGEGLFDPDDAIIDPLALLQLYETGARARGVEIRYGEQLESIDVKAKRVTAVHTNNGAIAASDVIVAAGAWAGEIAQTAGSNSVELCPKRRHLFRGQLAGRDCKAWPFVWNEEQGVYFLPEGDGLVLSPCDTDDHPAGTAEFDDSKRAVLAEKLASVFDGLGEWSLGPGWACLRTFAPDDRFVIGRDPQIQGLFWVAGLGGHGVTASWAVGRLAAEVFSGKRHAGPLDPARFTPSA